MLFFFLAFGGEDPRSTNIITCQDCSVMIGRVEIGTYRVVTYGFTGGPTVEVAQSQLRFGPESLPVFVTWDEKNRTLVHLGKTTFDVGPEFFNRPIDLAYLGQDGVVTIVTSDEEGPMNILWNPVLDSYRIRVFTNQVAGWLEVPPSRDVTSSPIPIHKPK